MGHSYNITSKVSKGSKWQQVNSVCMFIWDYVEFWNQGDLYIFFFSLDNQNPCPHIIILSNYGRRS